MMLMRIGSGDKQTNGLVECRGKNVMKKSGSSVVQHLLMMMLMKRLGRWMKRPQIVPVVQHLLGIIRTASRVPRRLLGQVLPAEVNPG
jgi:hypothetical protein